MVNILLSLSFLIYLFNCELMSFGYVGDFALEYDSDFGVL